jgi:hypothetical protein
MFLLMDDATRIHTFVNNAKFNSVLSKYGETNSFERNFKGLSDLFAKSILALNRDHDTSSSYRIERPVLEIFVSIFFFLSLGLIIFRYKDPYYILCFLFVFNVLIFAGVVAYSPTSKRLIIALPYIMVMASIVITQLTEMAGIIIPRISNKKLVRKVLTIAIVSLIVMINVDIYLNYYVKNKLHCCYFLSTFKIATIVNELSDNVEIFSISKENLNNVEGVLTRYPSDFINFKGGYIEILTGKSFDNNELDVNLDEIPIKKYLKKDAWIIFDGTNTHYFVNILLKHYPGSALSIIRSNRMEEFFYVFKIPKDIVNAKVDEWLKMQKEKGIEIPLK